MSEQIGYSFASWATLGPITATIKQPNMVVALKYEVFEHGCRVGSLMLMKADGASSEIDRSGTSFRPRRHRT